MGPILGGSSRSSGTTSAEQKSSRLLVKCLGHVSIIEERKLSQCQLNEEYGTYFLKPHRDAT